MYGTATNDIHPVLTEQEKLQNLADENAKLRTQLADAIESAGRMEERCAKLQEQVDYMTPLALYAASERERDHMRKLGIR